MTDLLLIFITACLANNLVLDHLLAVDPVEAMGNRIEAALSLGLAMMVFAPLVTVLGHALYVYWLPALGLEYLGLPALLLLVVAGVTLGTALLRRCNPCLHRRIADLVPLLLLNTALPAVALLGSARTDDPAGAFLLGLGSAAGVLIVVTAFAALQDRLAAADVPLPFQGVAIRLIALGLFAMAFMGFAGVRAI